MIDSIVTAKKRKEKKKKEKKTSTTKFENEFYFVCEKMCDF